MGLIFWKDNRKIDAFAAAVAEDLFSHVQPEVALQHFQGISQKNKKKDRKIEQKVAGIVAQINQFRETNSLGIYGKARLHKKFTERLHELGYDIAVTSKLDEIILLRMP